MSDLSMYDRVEKSAAMVRSRCGALPETAIILGSGLGDFAGTLVGAITMPYGDLPYSCVACRGPDGQLSFACGGTRLAALSGARISTLATTRTGSLHTLMGGLVACSSHKAAAASTPASRRGR